VSMICGPDVILAKTINNNGKIANVSNVYDGWLSFFRFVRPYARDYKKLEHFVSIIQKYNNMCFIN
jgi:ribosomal protein L9